MIFKLLYLGTSLAETCSIVFYNQKVAANLLSNYSIHVLFENNLSDLNPMLPKLTKCPFTLQTMSLSVSHHQSCGDEYF